MSGGDDVTLWCALSRLIADYRAEVDENGGRHAHEFYEAEGLYAVGNSRFEGRDKIGAFYARRRYAAMATRHIVTNLRAFADNQPHARMSGVMSLYRAEANRRSRASGHQR